MQQPGYQDVALVTVVDDVALDGERSNAFAELRPEATHPGLFGQQFEAVDDNVNESVGGGGLACSAM